MQIQEAHNLIPGPQQAEKVRAGRARAYAEEMDSVTQQVYAEAMRTIFTEELRAKYLEHEND